MKKRYTKNVLIIIAIGIVLAAALFLLYQLLNPDLSKRGDNEIRMMFECDRITLEVRNTDIYCSEPDQFRTDFKNGEVRKSS